MSWLDEPVTIPAALTMSTGRPGLLGFTAEVPDHPEGIGDLCLELSKKGLELSSLDEIGPKVARCSA